MIAATEPRNKRPQRPTIEPLFADLETAAYMLSVSESTVQALVRTGELSPPRRISGNRVGYLVDELKAFAASRPVSTLPPPPNTGTKKPKNSVNGA
jgi:prophage regulatory protein